MSDSPSVPLPNDFWFEDGDIVLSVTEDDVEHRFRVHRTILIMASPVFRDMLSMSQPAASESEAVTLRDDSVHDLKALLGALYYARKAPIQTLDMALGIMRLSHKYQIDGLQQGVKRKFMKDWPLNHADYLARLTFLGSPGYRVSQAAKVVETAQHCQINELLPTAFYELTCAWGTSREEIVRLLSPDNVIRLFMGRERSTQRLRDFVAGNKAENLMWKMSPSLTITSYREQFGPCRDHGFFDSIYCFGGFSTIRRIFSELRFDGTFVLPAIYQWDRTNFGKDVCQPCQDWYMDILKNKAQELWECIPTDFDLPAVDPELYTQSAIKIL